MKDHLALIWAVAISYPLFATVVFLSAPAVSEQQIWLGASLLLLLYISPQVFGRLQYLTRSAFYACLLVAAFVLLRLIFIPFFDKAWWLQMPAVLHIAFVLCFIVVGQSLHGFRLDRTPDYLYRAVNWQMLSGALKWAVCLILLSAAVQHGILVQQQIPGTLKADFVVEQYVTQEFSFSMLINHLFAACLLDIIRLRSQSAAAT